MRWVRLALSLSLAVLPYGRASDEPPSADEGSASREPDLKENGSEHTAEQVRATVEEHVERVVGESGGVYRLEDEEARTTLDLEFVHVGVVSAGALWQVHDPDRRVEGRAFFVCAIFHLVGAPQEKVYDVDMRVEPRDEKLVVTEVRLHKEKRLVNGEWIWGPLRSSPGGAAASGR
jgi:hypothetical protein